MRLPRLFSTNRNKGEPREEGEKLRYPYCVFFILTGKFFERLTFYGIGAILSLYFKKSLGFSEDTATSFYHAFICICTITPIVGGVLADQFLGKFKTILHLSFICIIGCTLTTLATIPSLGLDQKSLIFIGLFLSALGIGGSAPNMATLGGDQFKRPEQDRNLQSFFSYFYIAINSASLLASISFPILREVECLGDTSCYSLAFGLPAAFSALILLVIVLGRPLYKMDPPQGNVLPKVIGCIGRAVRRNMAGERGETHWLDVSKEKYGEQLVEDIKCLLRVLLLYVPIPVWWALFYQSGSRWTFQATRMDGSLGSVIIKPEQMRVLNPILTIIFLPLFDKILYPLCAKLSLIKKPLQKMSVGSILCAASFIVSGLLELQVMKTYAVVPGENSADLHLMNTINCPVMVEMKDGNKSQTIERIEMLGNKVLHSLVPGSYSLELSVEKDCQSLRTSSELLELEAGRVSGVLLSDSDGVINTSLIPRPEDPEKDADAWGRVRVVQVEGEEVVNNLTLIGEEKNYHFDLASSNYSSVKPGHYRLQLNSEELDSVEVEQGGVYTLVVSRDRENNKLRSVLHTLTTPNSIHMLWQLPQNIIMVASEVMFSATGNEFAYSQAPASMKSVVQAFWLLTTAVGQIIVIAVAEARMFTEQASEFFMFAGMMMTVTIVFIFLAWRFTPRVLETDQECKLPSNDVSPSPGSKPRVSPPLDCSTEDDSSSITL